MEAKLIKNADAYSVKINNEYVAFANEDFVGYATQEFRDNLLGKLSLKNCQAIELGYDLDGLAKQENGMSQSECSTIDEQFKFYEGYKSGFQKALEILGDKKCSEEDVRKAFVDAFQKCYEVINSGKFDDITSAIEWLTQTNADNYIQSLKQTEWDVEIVTTTIMENGKCGLDVPIIKPKLDADGYLILKRK